MKQYQMFELEFLGSEPNDSKTAVSLNTVFEWKNSEDRWVSKEIKGFYAGNEIYKVRFLPEEPGEYTWKVTGCIQAKGGERCEPASSGEKGIVRAKDVHFEYSDGTLFYPIGTTVYALVHQKEDLINQTVDSLRMSPFNKVRHCVFPKFYDYNKEEPELFAFEKDENGNWDMHHPCFAFWDRLEQVILKLAEYGIQSDLILFHPYDKWGFSAFTMEQCKLYLDYLLRRLAAFPSIWWSMANEFDLMYFRTMEDWYEIEEYIAENDPYHHLLSNHNCFSFYDFTRTNITHCCVQTTQMESASIWIEKYKKPVIYDECCYEGNLPLPWGNISGFEMASRFWQVYVQGAYASHGETFLDENEILWWAKGGTLKGSSPARIAFLREILEEIAAPLEVWEQKPWKKQTMGLMDFAPQELFIKLGQSMPKEQQEALRIKEAVYSGHVKDKVYLEYFGHHCCGIANWILPENHTYKIEIIDIWEMTREVVMTGVNGHLTIQLPGKEGIALLATSIERK